jgi:hypothetical protein
VLAVVALVLGLTTLVAGTPPWGWWVGVGSVAVIVLLTGAVQWREWHHSFAEAEGKPKAFHLDRTLDADLRKAAADTMTLFELTPADLALTGPDGRSPLVFVAPGPKARHRADGDKGGDWIHRFTEYRVTVLCLTPVHLAVHTFVLDMASGGRKEVDTHQYHHDYVAALHTATRPDPVVFASAVPNFPVKRRKPFVVHELEITSTDDTMVPIPTETSQARPAELRTPVTIADSLPALSDWLVQKVGWDRLGSAASAGGPADPQIPGQRLPTGEDSQPAA